MWYMYLTNVGFPRRALYVQQSKLHLFINFTTAIRYIQTQMYLSVSYKINTNVYLKSIKACKIVF